jgi:probable addiction module antidote protein
MALKTTRWDASEFLDNDEAVAAYLNAAFEDGDPNFIAASIGHVAKAKGMSQIARETGLSRESLYRALGDDGNPELSTMTKVMRALGMRIQIAPASRHRQSRRKRAAA